MSSFFVDLSCTLAGLRLANPVMAASGTFGYGMEMAPFTDLSRLGAVVLKTVTCEVRPGNPPPRICETPSGMLNSIGLANGGIDEFLAVKLPEAARLAPVIVVNFAGHKIEEYVDLARRLNERAEIAALEMNVSCPNVRGGMDFATNPVETERLVKAVRAVVTKPLITKLSPNVTDITVIARSAVAGGTDIVSLTNTFLGMAVDWRKRRPLLGNGMGGLSGPAIKPLALRMVYQVARAVEVPIIGIGGIMSADDVLEFMVAGASAVEVGSASFRDPNACVAIVEDLKQKLVGAGIRSVGELIGTLRTV